MVIVWRLDKLQNEIWLILAMLFISGDFDILLKKKRKINGKKVVYLIFLCIFAEPIKQMKNYLKTKGYEC